MRLRHTHGALDEIEANLETRTPSPEAKDEHSLQLFSAFIDQLDVSNIRLCPTLRTAFGTFLRPGTESGRPAQQRIKRLVKLQTGAVAARSPLLQTGAGAFDTSDTILQAVGAAVVFGVH
jgi:hypothetical protein